MSDVLFEAKGVNGQRFKVESLEDNTESLNREDINVSESDEESLINSPLNEISQKDFLGKIPKTNGGKKDFKAKVNSRKNEKIGDISEKRVIKYEEKYLFEKGYKDLKVTQMSQTNDAFGADISSYRINDLGLPEKIYIEVKTLSRNKNYFDISSNQIEKALNNPNNYYIYIVRGDDLGIFKNDFDQIFLNCIEQLIIEDVKWNAQTIKFRIFLN